MIVNTRLDFTRISFEADRISSAGHVAYWTMHSQPTVAGMMESNIIECFEKMAELLGYRVEKIEQPVEASEAAE